MQFTEKDLEYLSAKSFSSGYKLRFKFTPKDKNIVHRIEFLEKMLDGKSVLHLGCTDHIPLIDKKISENTWAHKRITEASAFCLGIDIDKDAIDHCHKLGYTNIIECDIFKDELPSELDQHFDYIVIGELLEHVDNPVLFLKQLKSFFKSNFSNILITGPNALKWKNISTSFSNSELINSDHRFWFSPYTLAKLLTRSSFTPDQYWFGTTGGVNKRNYLYKWLLKRYPQFQDTIIMTAKV